MKRMIFSGLVFFLVCFFPKLLFAQDAGWVIDTFDSSTTILQTGKINVHEEISVDFASLEKHGIYRDIPYVYEDSDGKKAYSEINIESVSREGRAETYEKSTNDNNIRIKIGDANKTVSGKHIYDVTYEVAGVLRGFSDHDELYWNVTGNGWGVPIGKASSRVSVEGTTLLQATCFQGYPTDKDPCMYEVSQDKKAATFVASRPLQPGEGLTIVAGYEKGIVPLLIVQKPKTLFEKVIEPSSFLFLGALLLGALTIAFFLWYKYGRDYSFIRRSVFGNPTGEKLQGIGEHETVVVEYTPPENLRPAEIGVLTDERADTLDVVATIIDLASRGYLTITEVGKSWIFGKTDYRLTRKKEDTAGLLSYEKVLFDKLFDDKKEVTVSSLKTTFYADLATVKKSLYERVVTAKFFSKSPEKMRTTFIVIGLLCIFLGFFFFAISAGSEVVFFVDIAIGVGAFGVMLFVISPFMSRRTAYGREMYRRVKGYQLFIATAEKYRQRFFEKKNLFNEVLPYAIVFGLTEKFSQAMKDIGLPEKQMAAGWYIGAHAFNYSTFSSNMNDFSKSLSTAIAASPKSSGFSSGGGFSGGGFGGGGGGSW